MKNFEDLSYDKPRTWIREKREQGKSWEEILIACKSAESKLSAFLENQEEDNDWPTLSVEDWKILVQLQKESEEETITISQQNGAATIHDDNEENEVTVPRDKASAWQTYKKGLLEKGFLPESVDEIERATLKVLKRLSRNTEPNKAIKGLVIGNVQSGKTANMAALMAMSADWGWNMFIVLSGTIDNLRKQTQSRLFEDLNREDCRLIWRSLEHLKKKMSVGSRAQDMQFEKSSMQRYFTVCLKNGTRLKDLIQWLQYSPTTQQNMRVLVIDDEADQAGINTADISSRERTRINKLICALVNGQDEKNKPIDSRYQAMNYIGYTATPYANVLNESGEDSLYPRNFISTLAVSKEYFGPQQIFGIEGGDYDGLDIVRCIDEDELDLVKDIHNGDADEMPDQLRNALCWFICGVACMRLWKYKKPISMLVHTSQKTDHHSNVAQIIEDWLKKHSTEEIIEECEIVWEREVAKLSKTKFREQYPDFKRLDSEISDYPSFEQLIPYLHVILNGTRVSSIKLGEDKTFEYHDGLHLCVDNCKNNGVEDDYYLRLAYPDKDHMPTPAPAFIVVGGATLSRGLTLEGLISTYFLRTVNQSDTLMQMGRWFGYRKGYELIPRVWLSEKTKEQFQFLSSLDQELRDEIHEMEVLGKSPAHYGPKVKNTPKLQFIRITAKNRMQSATPSELDFSGTYKQTFLFDTDEDKLKHNLNKAAEFLDKLSAPESKEKCCRTSALVWRNIPFKAISAFLKDFNFHTRLGVFNDIDPFISWIETMTDSGKLHEWNVVLAGNEERGEQFTLKNGFSVSKVNRARVSREDDDNVIDIHVLRNPKDLLADIDPNEITDDALKKKIDNPSVKGVKDLRIQAGYGDIPQLAIYIVDKNSKARKDSETRVDLNAPVDLVGLSIVIPGSQVNTDFVAKIAIKMPEEDVFNDNGDIDGTDED